MTAKFEFEQEQLKRAYKKREIGKLTFTKRMTALGFSIGTCRQFMDEEDMRRSQSIGVK